MKSDARFERTIVELIDRLDKLSPDQLVGRDKWLTAARRALVNARENPRKALRREAVARRCLKS